MNRIIPLLLARQRAEIHRRQALFIIQFIILLQAYLEDRYRRRYQAGTVVVAQYEKEGSYTRERRLLRASSNPKRSTVPLRYTRFRWSLDREEENWVKWKLKC